MVPIKADLQKMNFISLLYLQANILESGRDLCTQYFSPILDRTNKMIQKQAFIVTLVNMFAHTHKCKYPHATPEAEPRGILLIKKEHEVVSIQKALPVQTFQRKTADVKDVSQPTENKGSAFQQSIDTEFDLKKLRAKHYVLAYIFECYAKGETLPNGNKTKLQRIGDERMGAGKGNTFYKNFNSIVIKDMNAENILIEIGGKNWRKAIIGLSKAPEIVEKYLQSKQL